MEYNIRSGDDYLKYVAGSLDEVKREIDSAATVFVESDEARRQLGEALGQARNALKRAHRDLNAHVARQLRHEDRSTAEAYYESLRLTDDDLPQIIVAIVPLPLEEERISAEIFSAKRFQDDFTNWVTRFNYEEQRKASVRYLQEVPGSTWSSRENEFFQFNSAVQGVTEPSQSARLYPSGAFIFKRRWYSHVPLSDESIREEVRRTIQFAWRLFDEVNLVPRSFAVQASLRSMKDVCLQITTRSGDLVDWFPRDGVVNIVAPLDPIVLPFSTTESTILRVLSAVQSTLQAHYIQASAS
jgi:hypothetical protein